MPRPVKKFRNTQPDKREPEPNSPENREQLYVLTSELPKAIGRVISQARLKDNKRMKNKTSDKPEEKGKALPDKDATGLKADSQIIPEDQTGRSLPEEHAKALQGNSLISPEDENEPLKDRLELAGIELKQQDRSSRKLVSFVLAELGKHKNEAIDGKIIDIPYSRFVEAGLFSDRVSTEHALKEGCKVLRCLKLSSKNRKAIAKRSKRRVMNLQASVFQYVYTGNNALHVRIETFKPICEKVPGLDPSDFVNWETVFSQYVKAPCWLYEVYETSFQIAKMALELSRMQWQRKKVVESGKFRIHMPDLIEYLCLGEQRKLKEKVIEPVERALKEINRLADRFPEEGLRFNWNWEGMTSREICRDGFVEVEISGKIYDCLKAIQNPYKKPKKKDIKKK